MFDPIPRDVLVQRQVEEAIAAGHPLPRWGWKTPTSYNGSTGAERIGGWQKVRIAEQLGLLGRDGICSVCHTARAEQFHAELYIRCIAVKQVCRSCHFHVHRRFVDPDRWHSFVSDRSQPGDWALCLRVIQLDRREAEEIAAQPDIFAALGCNQLPKQSPI